MDDREPNRVSDTERTTIIHSDGGRGGGSGVLLAVLVLILLAVVLFFLFGGNFGRDGDEGDVNVNVEAPIDIPDVNVNLAPSEPAGNTTNSSQ